MAQDEEQSLLSVPARTAYGGSVAWWTAIHTQTWSQAEKVVSAPPQHMGPGPRGGVLPEEILERQNS